MTDKYAALTATTTDAAKNRMQEASAIQAKILRKRALLAEIGGKWGKFSEQELSDLKSSDELTAQLVRKYGLEPDAAHRAVTALLAGRAL